MQCACGNQDLEYKSGISKKTGKKWQGYKCEPCNLMMGMDGRPWGDMASAPKAPQNYGNAQKQAYSAPTQTVHANPNNGLEKKVDLILDILKREFPNANDDVEVPF